MSQKWRTSLWYLAICCVALFVFPLLFQELMYWTHTLMKVRPIQKAMREKLETFLSDEKLLVEEPFFQASPETANAAPYLNFRLEWAPATPSLVRQITQNPPKISVPESLKDELRQWGAAFPEFHSQVNYESFDLSWMNEILQFNFWDLTELSPVNEIFERKHAMSFYLTQTAAPQFEELVLMAKLRLMKGMWEGNVPQAMRETRHFAKLLYSTETLLGALASIAILRAERTLIDYLESHLQSSPGQVSALSPTVLNVARRAVLGFSAYPTIFTPPEILKKVFLENPGHVGVCPALAKGILRGLMVRPLLEPQSVLERRFKDSFVALDEVVEKTGEKCRLRHLKKLWKDRQSRLVWLGLVGDSSWDWINLHVSQRLPFIRRGWGVDLSALFLSNGLEAYP